MIKVHYGIDFLNAIGVEWFNNLTEAKKWIKAQRNEDFELMDVQMFDKDGYFIKDILMGSDEK